MEPSQVEPLKVAVMQNREGREVGRVIATPNPASCDHELEVTIKGSRGQQIAELLNQSELILGSDIIPGRIWVKPLNCPRHTRSIDLALLVAAMSEAELRVRYEETAMRQASRQVYALRFEHCNQGEWRTTEEVLEKIKALEHYEPHISAVERLVHEYHAAPRQSSNWLDRFAEAFAASE